MEKAKKQIVTVQKMRQVIHLSIVEKQNETGFSYNQRLFLLSQGKQFGYISKFRMTDNPKDFQISQCKVHQPIKSIKKVSVGDDIVKLHFSTTENKKNIEKVWALKLASKELANQWNNKIQQQINKSNGKKSKSSQKQLSPKKSQQRLSNASQFQKQLLKEKLERVQRQDRLQREQDSKMKPEQIKRLSSRIKQNEEQNKFLLSSNQNPYQNNPQNFNKPNPISNIVKNPIYNQPIIEEKQEQNNKSRDNFLAKEPSKFSSPSKNQSPLEKKQSRTRKSEQKNIRPESPYQEKKTVQNSYQNKIMEENLNQFTRNSKPWQKQKQKQIERQRQRQNMLYNQYNNSPQKKDSTNYYQMIKKVVNETKSKENLNKEQLFQDRNYEKLTNNQYLNRKKQAQIPIFDQIKQVEENEGLNAKNEKNQFENIDDHYNGWTYKFLTRSHAEVFQEFQRHCQNIAYNLITQISLRKQKQKYALSRGSSLKYIPVETKNQNYQIYQIDDILIKVCLMNLKQSLFEKSSVMGQKICDNKALKIIKNEFKNYHLLYKAIQNKGRVIVPLTALIQYQGFTLYFKTLSQFVQNDNIWKTISDDLIKIEQKTHISLQTLANQQGTKIYPLDKQHYSKIYQAYHRQSTYSRVQQQMFDKYVIQDLASFLPIDLLFEQRFDESKRLRNQLINFLLDSQDQSKNPILGYNQVKSKRASEVEINKIRAVSKKVLQCISNVISALDNLDFVPLNSQQLSQFMHLNGVNIRYLSLIYENLALSFTKSIIAAQIAARTCKIVFQKTIQDIALQNNGKINNGKQFSLKVLDDAIDFLNCIVGNTYQTTTLWKILQIHSNQYFNVSFIPEDINRGYFLLALVHHCKIKVIWSRLNYDEVFKSSHLFNQSNVQSFIMDTKSYDPVFEPKYMRVMQLIQDQTEQNFERCVKELNLQKYPIPTYFYMNKNDDKLKRFLTSFIHPQTVIPSQLKYTHLKLFQTSQSPKRSQIQIDLTQIRWYMKQRKRQKYIKACHNFLNKVHKYYGDYHPLLCQIYELFSQFHMKNGQLQDSITFSKSSLVTIIKLCSTNHLKTAQAYYQLALCYIKACKKQEAISQLIKSKNIFQNNSRTQSFGYAVILNKLSLLQLNQSNIEDGIKLALGSLALLDKLSGNNQDDKNMEIVCNVSEQKLEDQRTQGYQILARSYQLLKRRDEQIKLSNFCSQRLKQVKNPLNLERNIKICLYPHLSSLSPQFASSYLDIISQIPLNVSTSTYGQAYKYLRNRILQNSFMQNFKSYILNISSIEQFISKNESLKNWQNFATIYQRQTVNDFICLTEQLLFFLGEGFVTGSIRQAL